MLVIEPLWLTGGDLNARGLQVAGMSSMTARAGGTGTPHELQHYSRADLLQQLPGTELQQVDTAVALRYSGADLLQ
jgi:hypothetical protein